MLDTTDLYIAKVICDIITAVLMAIFQVNLGPDPINFLHRITFGKSGTDFYKPDAFFSINNVKVLA